MRTIYAIISEPLANFTTAIERMKSEGFRELIGDPDALDKNKLCEDARLEDLTALSLETGDFAELTPTQAKKFREKIEKTFSDYKICEIFMFANAADCDMKESLFQKESREIKTFYGYFKERCSEDNVFSVNCPPVKTTPEAERILSDYFMLIVNSVEGKESSLNRFHKQIEQEFLKYKNTMLKKEPDTIFNEAYGIAKMTEIYNCLSALNPEMRDDVFEKAVDYENKHGDLLSALYDYEFNYDCSMWSNWDDILDMAEAFLEFLEERED